jgi:hypothetical protein
MQAKIGDAEDLYARAVKIGDLAKAPDDVIDPVLRTYAKILRELHRDKDARPLELRVREAIQRRAEREGYQTIPASRSLDIKRRCDLP